MLKYVKKISGMFCVLFALTANAQDSLIINGTIDKSMDCKKITLSIIYPFLSNLTNHPIISQESTIVNGKFSFGILANTLESYSISINGNVGTVSYFLLEPKRTEILFLDTLLKKYVIKGNDIDKEYKEISRLLDRSKFSQYEVNLTLLSLIENNPKSPLSIFHLSNLEGKIPDDKILSLYKTLPDEIKTNSSGIELKYILENLYVGTKAPEFIQSDTSGKKIKLSDFKGKYVLLDFWASWCNPCRTEHPYLIKVFNKYHKNNFDILSFSLDKKRDEWMNAIHKDKIGNWKHVSDLLVTDNFVSRKLYKIIAIPVNYLIDPDGIIVAKNIWGKELYEKLKSLKL